MQHAIPISGKDSLATYLIQVQRQPELDYTLFYNETGAETPETTAWLDKVAAHIGKSIIRIGDNLEDVIDEQGILPGHGTRFCTRKVKIEPTEQYFKEDVTIYYGLRADEPERVGYERRTKNGRGSNMIASFPLRETGYTLPMVWALLYEHDLLPPAYFWQSVYQRVLARLGDDAGILDTLKPWEFRALFAWRSRDNCYYCFYQRLYEWAGLLEHYPDLYWHAVEIEERTGAKDYSFNSAKSLRQIATEALRLREKRAEAIVKMLYATTQGTLPGFSEATLQDAVSCGLLCGK